jgi:hypothetical protein
MAGLCAAEPRAQRCADLVGKRDGNQSCLEGHLVAGCRSEDEATQSLSAVLDKEFDLGTRTAHAIHTPDTATEQQVPVVS